MTESSPTRTAAASFAPRPTSVASARRFVRSTLADWGADSVVDAAVLLASELVTNAVVHAGTTTDVLCTRLPDAVRVDVVDRHSTRWLPAAPERVDADREGGRGVYLTATLATSWGVEHSAECKRVWFRLELPPGERTGLPLDRTAVPALAGPADQPADPPADSGLDLVRDIPAGIGIEELLQLTVERSRDGLGGDAAFAVLGADADGEGEVRASTGLPATAAVQGGPGSPGWPDGSQRIVHDDVTTDAGPASSFAGTGLRSVVMVPFRTDGGVLGTLAVASGQPGIFTDADGERLQRAADHVAVALEGARLTELARRRRGVLSFLAEATELLAGTLDADMTVALAAQLVVPRLSDWCVVHLVDDSGTSAPSYVWHADEDRLDDLRRLVAKAPAPRVRATAGAEPWTIDPELLTPESPIAAAGDLVRWGASSVPLAARGRALGTLTVGFPPSRAPDSQTVALLEDLARRAALALANARLYQERAAIARALQLSLLPPELPATPGLDVAVVYEAAGEGNDVGGDFYDLFAVADGRWSFAIGDVCGKGAEAAAVTGLARHALRLLGRRGDPVAHVLGQLNRAILDEGSRARFLTLVHGTAEPRPDGAVEVVLACAGHPQPLRLTAAGTVEAVGTSGSLLGVLDDLDDLDVPLTEVRLLPGEALVCFTDGVTERRAGARMLGDQGLATALQPLCGASASAVAAAVRRLVVDFADEPPRDDMAVLVLRAPSG